MMRTLGHAFTVALMMLGSQTGVAFSARWNQVNDGLTGSVPGVTKLLIDRSGGSTLYALTSANSIFKSSDRGATWKALGSIVGVLDLAIDPSSASTIYAGTSHGV